MTLGSLYISECKLTIYHKLVGKAVSHIPSMTMTVDCSSLTGLNHLRKCFSSCNGCSALVKLAGGYKKLGKICLAYDNMCHLDGLNTAQKPLPFPDPLNRLWINVHKFIDVFHHASDSERLAPQIQCNRVAAPELGQTLASEPQNYPR